MMTMKKSVAGSKIDKYDSHIDFKVLEKLSTCSIYIIKFDEADECDQSNNFFPKHNKKGKVRKREKN